MEIERKFTDFKQDCENLLLYGRKEELEDMHREQPDFTIVPLTKEHFDLLNEQGFLDLLSGLDI